MIRTNPIIAIIAGEVSGDILAAGLINALKIRYPDAKFIGVAGPQMVAAGCEKLADMEELAVMGLTEVIKHLPRLLKLRQSLLKQFLALKPDIFIGIDAPDFNLDLEIKLKQNGIKTLHYVSPSVWAWRQKRVHKIAKAVDMLLALLPFEKAFYDRFNVPCRFVGHTMADSLPLKPNRDEACRLLGIDRQQRYLALLPGSRQAEIEFLAEPFLQTVRLLQQKYPKLQVLVPLVNSKRKAQFAQIVAEKATDLNLTLLDGQARQAMIVAEATLLASGTAALECMLCKSPMVVAYRMKSSTYWLAKRLVKTKYISLPNLLADQAIIPEMIQADCQAEKLAEKLSIYLETTPQARLKRHSLLQRFTDLHRLIQQDADHQAAQAVIDLLEHPMQLPDTQKISGEVKNDTL
ncbi:lipid-A-disaccharide synthase [Mergibacter septicus]|uniref:Lipid-A-disaccharide synthase n=1 Tax=Mergibacter septicus TaxID=221402 RepID=A0A8D4J0A4_9PAST|nr:lipid-A-disaccharide synthase [Mergibacter septicus]AWX15627.1 lipid-A-disaccharide synthase [Mergibacter septicus]QDJ14881.1 lipid-A-disaccharide synthase [Mergibacter septicus]UTU47692.1 lipid-A-disaccharide synthase [Mergibacter septicus]WMR96701.1 lipid-A-disaccharide synthase [Mergibacter septicus]